MLKSNLWAIWDSNFALQQHGECLKFTTDMGIHYKFLNMIDKDSLEAHVLSVYYRKCEALVIVTRGRSIQPHSKLFENPHWTFIEKEKWFRKWQAIDRSVLFSGVSGLLKLYTLKNRVSGKTNVYASTCMEFSGPCLKRISIIWIISRFKVFVVDLVLL